MFFIWTLRRDQTDGPTRPIPASSHQCRPSGPGRWAETSWQPPLLTDGTAAAARSTLTVGVSGRGWESRTRLVRRGGPPVPELCRLMGWVNSIWSLSLIFVKCFGLFFLFIFFIGNFKDEDKRLVVDSWGALSILWDSSLDFADFSVNLPLIFNYYHFLCRVECRSQTDAWTCVSFTAGVPALGSFKNIPQSLIHSILNGSQKSLVLFRYFLANVRRVFVFLKTGRTVRELPSCWAPFLLWPSKHRPLTEARRALWLFDCLGASKGCWGTFVECWHRLSSFQLVILVLCIPEP